MIIKASGRSALILVTGLFVCLAAPSQAAPGTDKATASSKSESAAAATATRSKYAKRGVRHWKKYAQRKSGKAALHASAGKKSTEVAGDGGDGSIRIPPSIANANAQLASAEAPADSARSMSAKATTILQAAADQPATDSQVVAADQLNDVDRALQESRPLALAAAEPPAVPAAPVMASSKEESTWDQTSLIGKIFIGLGALLTMASAARMFMA
jgi:hypothetical protein